MPQSGGQNHKWPTSGPNAYITPANRWVPCGSERGTKSEGAHKWAQWLYNPCHWGVPLCLKVEDKITTGPQKGPVAQWLHNPYHKITSGPEKGPSGYITPAARGRPLCFKAGDKIRSGPQVGPVAI